MPPATLVIAALPPILARMMSWRGPQAFFQSPMISTGTGSGFEPWNTVHAVPFMPGFNCELTRISVGPAVGGVNDTSCPKQKVADTIKVKNAADRTLIRQSLYQALDYVSGQIGADTSS